jgi:guanylate kinase
MSAGIPIIISAPSGAGKTSLVDALLEQVDDVKVAISHTTRPKRQGEENGKDYQFISQPEFQKLIEQNAFLEHARVFDHYYGTARYWVEQYLQQGMDIIFEIDWQGARQIRAKLPHAISIFILPPSLQVLKERLQHRGQDKPEIIAKRMQLAKDEIHHYHEFDYLLVNDCFSQALEDLRGIIRCQRLQQQRHSQRSQQLLTELLQ